MTGDLLDVEALASLSDRQVEALRNVLRTSGYDAALLARAESIAPGRLDAIRLPLVQRWLTDQPGPGPVLARLLAYRDSVGREEAFRALGASVGIDLEGCGALVTAGDRLRSRMRLVPFADVWIASDEADARHDPVMGPGATTQQLLEALPIALPARVLDVGCGAGSLALAAARTNTSVTALDIDPRAAALTRWNARLNNRSVSVHVGDLLTPVEGQSFDLVVAQPPFVPNPPDLRTTTYLHGGARGDELALRLLHTLPKVLAPGGRALILLDTAPPSGSTAIDRIRAELPDQPLQLSVVSARGHHLHTLALGYAAAADSTLGPIYAETVRRYGAHFHALGVDTTRHVLVALRKPLPDEPTWAISVEPRGPTPYDATALEHLDAALAVATLAPSDFVRVRVAPPAGARIVHVQPLDDSDPATPRFECPSGRAPDQELSDAAVQLMTLAAAGESIGSLVRAYANACDEAPEAVETSVLDFLRKALVSGLLVPLGSGP